MPVCTLIEETLHVGKFQNTHSVKSISSVETAIEKWVALTRKIIAIERGYYHDDSSLIRHVYDLIAINKQTFLSDEFYNISIAVISTDVEQFKNQHPEYAIDPCAEINRSLEILKENPLWLERYNSFLEGMIFGSTINPTYQESIATIEIITSNIIKQFNQEDFELLMLAKSRLDEKNESISVNLADI